MGVRLYGWVVLVIVVLSGIGGIWLTSIPKPDPALAPPEIENPVCELYDYEVGRETLRKTERACFAPDASADHVRIGLTTRLARDQALVIGNGRGGRWMKAAEIAVFQRPDIDALLADARPAAVRYSEVIHWRSVSIEEVDAHIATATRMMARPERPPTYGREFSTRILMILMFFGLLYPAIQIGAKVMGIDHHLRL